jgi:hypothetical protein
MRSGKMDGGEECGVRRILLVWNCRSLLSHCALYNIITIKEEKKRKVLLIYKYYSNSLKIIISNSKKA